MNPTYTDETPMPWGQYKGQRLGDVPASYLDWLIGRFEERPNLNNTEKALCMYIKSNRDVIRAELEEAP